MRLFGWIRIALVASCATASLAACGRDAAAVREPLGARMVRANRKL